ncbi:MAG: transporter [Acidobacteria bacterium]|nr:transporter [Acidobacteriota bacterium]
MNRRRLLNRLVALGVSTALCGLACEAGAQQLILKGEYGLMAGTQPPPGLYAGILGGYNRADELKGPRGETVPTQGSLNQYYIGPIVSWVSNIKILGGNYSATVSVPWANVMTDAPRLDVNSSTGIALSETWLVPLAIGWHLEGADVTFQYALYIPTGRYTAGATDNTSLGMWCNELSVLSTVFLNGARSWHASASLFYDINGRKQDQDWTTGNPLTLMYGVGGNYGSGQIFKGWAGIAGYSQWQVTSTSGADVPLPVRDGRTDIHAIGPEFTTLQGALTIRYFWQFGGTFSTQGRGLYVQLVLPVRVG